MKVFFKHIVLSLIVILGYSAVNAQTITISTTNPSVAAGNTTPGSTKVPMYRIQVDVSGGGANISGLSFTPTGTFVAADLDSWEFWYSTTDDIATASQNGPGQTPLAPGNQITLGPYNPYWANDIYYVWICADIDVAATSGATINIGALTTSNFTFSGGSKVDGGISANGTQTIVVPQTFYSKPTNGLDLSDATNWNTNTDGTSGTDATESDFDDAIDVFIVQSGYNYEFTTNETVAGTLTVNGQVTPNPSTVVIDGGTINGTGTIDVNHTSGFSTQYNFATKTLTSATVDYVLATGGQTVSAITYGNLTFSNTSGTQTAAGNIEVSGALAIQNGGATLAMGANTIGASSAPTSFSIDAGATITGTGQMTINGNVTVTDNAASANSADINVPVALGGSARTFTVANATNTDDLILDGIISGTGGIIKAGSGRIVVNGNNTYSGATTVSAGEMQVGHANALGTTGSGTTVSSGAVLEIDGGVTLAAEAITVSGSGVSSNGAIRSISGSNEIQGAITQAAASEIQVDAGTLTLSGGITGTFNLSVEAVGDIVASGALTISTGTVTKTGAGNLYYTANNTYTGATTISAGDIYIGNNTAAGAIVGNIDVAASTTAYFDCTSDLSLAGVISGAGNVVKNNTNKLTLTGTNTQSGSFTINDGQVDVGGGGTTGTIATTVTLAASNSPQLHFNRSNAYTFSQQITGGNANALVLQIGSGVTTISSTSNDYTGDTKITAGGIQLGAAGVIPDGSAIEFNGGTLDVNGYDETVGTILLTENSTLAFGSGAHTLTCASSTGETWTGAKTLTVTGWTCTAGSSGVTGDLVVASSGFDAGQLAQVSFNGYSGAASFLGTEVVPTAGVAAITVSTGSLTGYTYQETYGPSSSQSYTVSGTDLSADITVTAPTNYEVSTDNSTFSGSVVLSESCGSVTSTTIYVRLKAGLSVSTYNGENVTNVSGATSQNVSNDGSVTSLPTTTLASASQVAAGNVEQGSENAISAFTLAVADADAELNTINFTTGGTYAAADVTNFKLWYHTSNSFGSASVIKTITTSLGSGSHSFTGLTQTISSGNTGYFWISATIDPSATITNTINVDAIATSDVSMNKGSKAGSITAGGTQTIIVASYITYYSNGGNWNDPNNWYTDGCGGSTNTTGLYPGQSAANDVVVICNGTSVTQNVDFSSVNQATINSGGTWTVSDNIMVDAPVDASAGTMSFGTTLELGADADIDFGNQAVTATTIVYNDSYAGSTSARIQTTGTITVTTVKAASGSDQGGSLLSGGAITITNYGNLENGVDMYFDGSATNITNYQAYGNTIFETGDLTITNWNQANGGTPDNNISSSTADLIVNDNILIKGTSTRISVVDLYAPSGIRSEFTSTPIPNLMATNIYLGTSLHAESSSEIWLEGNVIQTSAVTVTQNANGNLYVKDNWDSNGYSLNFSNTNATFKVEGNAIFDNVSTSSHLNSNADIVVLGNLFLKGSGTWGANDGSVYVGGFLQIDELQLSFQNTAKIYLAGTTTAADLQAAGVYDGSYDGTITVGGAGNHPRDASNNPDNTGGRYISIAGGEIDNAATWMAALGDAAGDGVDTQPESGWLPIKLIKFFTELGFNGGVEVYWVTASEINNDYFTLYSSKNGIHFNEVAVIPGQGNSNELVEYNYLDTNVSNGINYYQLKQTDFDGVSTYSNIIAIELEYKNFILQSLFTKGNITSLELEFVNSDDVNVVRIMNSYGNVLYEEAFEYVSFGKIYLSLKPGLYVISNTNSSQEEQTKFIVR